MCVRVRAHSALDILCFASGDTFAGDECTDQTTVSTKRCWVPLHLSGVGLRVRGAEPTSCWCPLEWSFSFRLVFPGCFQAVGVPDTLCWVIGLQDGAAATSDLDVRRGGSGSRCAGQTYLSSHAPGSQRAGCCLTNRLIAPRPHLYISNVNFLWKACRHFSFCCFNEHAWLFVGLFTQRRSFSSQRDGFNLFDSWRTCLT